MYVAKVLAVLLIFAAVTSATEGGSDYIIGGQNGTPGQFGFKVSLRTFAHRHFCGGVIVNRLWFMSAAHCVSRFINNPRTFLIVANPVGERRGSIFTTTRIVLHPRYSAKLRQNDIALMRAVAPIRLVERFIIPVRMPKADTSDNNRSALILTGLGLTRVRWLSLRHSIK